MNDMLISKSRVRGFLQRDGVRVSKELYEALNKRLCEILLEAKERAVENGRSTVMPQDL